MNDSPVAKRWTALKDLAECAVVVMCMCKKGKNVYCPQTTLGKWNKIRSNI